MATAQDLVSSHQVLHIFSQALSSFEIKKTIKKIQVFASPTSIYKAVLTTFAPLD